MLSKKMTQRTLFFWAPKQNPSADIAPFGSRLGRFHSREPFSKMFGRWHLEETTK